MNNEQARRFLEYELAGSDWWVSCISWSWAQKLAARYFAWKTRRKMDALDRVRARAEFLQWCERRSAEGEKP